MSHIFPTRPSNRKMRFWFLPAPLFLFAVACLAQTQEAVIPTGIPLRVQIDKRYPISPGTKVEGHLIAPVYLVDHEVLPVNTLVTGSIVDKHPVNHSTRTDAVLNGDFTPLATPELRFDHIILPDGTVEAISTHVVQRNGTVVRMKSGKKPSLTQQAEEQIRQREHDALDQIRKPGKSNRLLQMLYGELPYHPQRIWPGTQYDAELTSPLSIAQKDPPAPLPVVQPLDEKALKGTIEARLTEDLSSATAKKGDHVDAVFTRPLLDSTKTHVLLPEGTHLEGIVLEARPARRLARNGKLRFTFRQVDLPQTAVKPAPQPGPVLESPVQLSTRHEIHGRMIASEANRKQNVQIDSEGGAQATGGPDKYVAPLVLGLLAASAGEGDSDNVVKNGTVSNGFGIMARIATMATANKSVALGFAFYALAKSLYKRWIGKGSNLTFPKNTRLQIELSER